MSHAHMPFARLRLIIGLTRLAYRFMSGVWVCCGG